MCLLALSPRIHIFARQQFGPLPSLFSFLYSPLSVLSHSTLYSNLPIFTIHLPVIYGKGDLFEPLFKPLILIFLRPLAAFKTSPARA